ncbi:TerC/Alx family metal homeostasis membrane protein [Ornithobacterium rhinotracheale]|uniref:Integral membrane protein, TerC family n=1 Tax=Ornithobacterium rhinotracheale (strain ATCC 51463 / DSM 15997 / CCUG 23171 / CIP 104009 / LMG 9086) TaxID=867902 RepID=I3ZXK3_ORNRL|nr:TerC/Alx family metal homeostasis membrane protein [Ornithobacterium rhinotracheale]AFL96437.1 integral membrane protein, TerC family [Ornithobacterium rhinotracheale DSM 15997]AIP98649.1 membrane protein [Ornithobacterium rhinotracheale ORT-UMN 88]KGB67644.1 membrane protein [Ornithobacterium rhinotracheale H06-030791]MCK0194765.1 TerC/Alx family metal homeostasis membrane protein [Ornithobacterium rhinotracheale]MCK0200768.1 TerC/Alx family metal homeostasis membrane protein [Ornithobacte
MDLNLIVWICLLIFIAGLLAFDLLVLHKTEDISHKKTAIETLFWIAIAMGFSGVLYLLYKNELVHNPTHLTPYRAAVKYITGYLIELSLSVDNLFVIAMIFTSYKIPLKYQHKALFWGIIGAIVFRGIMIAVGVVLFNKVSWIVYVFGVFLLFTAVKMLWEEINNNEEIEEETSALDKFMHKHLKMSQNLDGNKFFTIENGVKVATPLFGALVIIELTDLLFAVDSIPAILAISHDSLIVFCATIFATLGLRSMYFFLANMLERFRYLKFSVIVILFYIGVKMLLIHHIEIPEWFSLSVIFVSILVGILASLKAEKNAQKV